MAQKHEAGTTKRIAVSAPPPVCKRLQQELNTLQGIEFIYSTSVEELVGQLTDIDAVVLPVYFYEPEVAAALKAATPRLKWIQLINAGYDRLNSGNVPAGVTVSTAGDSLAPAVSDHALSLILSLQRRLPEAWNTQQKCQWDRSTYAKSAILHGETALVFGFGAIGQSIGKRLQAFGVKVTAVNRSGKPNPFADKVVTTAQLNTELPHADLVVIASELNDETRGIFNAQRLALIKKDALIINVARGPIIETDTLVEALRSGQLGGAGLDVTEPEPLPENHPLWKTPNTIITSHVAGGGSEGIIANFVRRNIEQFIAGNPVNSIIKL